MSVYPTSSVIEHTKVATDSVCPPTSLACLAATLSVSNLLCDRTYKVATDSECPPTSLAPTPCLATTLSVSNLLYNRTYKGSYRQCMSTHFSCSHSLTSYHPADIYLPHADECIE